MHAGFRLQPTERVLPRNLHCRRLDSCFAVPVHRNGFNIVAASLCPLLVHAGQHHGPVTGFGASRTGIDVHERIIGIGLTAEQGLQLHLLGPFQQVAKGRRRLGQNLLIILGFGKLDQGNGVLELAAETVHLVKVADDGLTFTHQRLRPVAVVPEVGSLRHLVEFLQPPQRSWPVQMRVEKLHALPNGVY